MSLSIPAPRSPWSRTSSATCQGGRSGALGHEGEHLAFSYAAGGACPAPLPRYSERVSG